VVFEDSIFGVKAAKAAGMSCIAVTTGVYSAAELERESLI
jgi:beta-phosphoglucomutase-like phosphatase (HAD superfamily)